MLKVKASSKSTLIAIPNFTLQFLKVTLLTPNSTFISKLIIRIKDEDLICLHYLSSPSS